MILAVGVVLIVYCYMNEEAVMRSSLLNRTLNASEGIRPALLQQLDGSPADLDLPAYQEIKQYLTRLVTVYPDLRFAYLMGRRPDGTVIILADNEAPDSPDYSPPGDVYGEATNEEHDVFDDGVAMVIGPSEDRWGVFVTGYVPVFDEAGRNVVALFGMDISASDWSRQALIRTLPTAAFGLFLLAFAAFGYQLRRRHRSGDAAPGWRARIEVVAVIVCGLLLTAFFCLYLVQYEARVHLVKFEQLATSETDLMATRIETIRDNHLVSIQRYFESSRIVTRDEFNNFTRGLLDDPMILGWAWLPEPGGDERPRMPAMANPHLPDEDPAADFQHPERRAAIDQALRTGLAASTMPIPETAKQPASRLFVYKACRGQVPGLLRLEIDLTGLDPRPNRHGTLHHHAAMLQEDGSVFEFMAAERSAEPMEEMTRPVSAFGQLFLITSHQPVNTVGVSDHLTPLLALATGLSFTTGIAILIGAPIRRREQLQRLVDEQTRELSEREQQFRLIAESMRDVVWVVDIERWTYTYVSPSIKRIGGYTPQEIMDQRPDFTLVDAQREHLINQLKARTEDFLAGRIGTENYFIDEILQRHRNGREFWTEVITSFTRNPVNGRLEIRGTTRDISERRQAEIALEENRRFLSDLIENSGALIFVKNRKGVYTLVNRRWEVITGIPRDRTLGRRDADLFPANLAAHFATGDEQVFETGAVCEQEEQMAFTGDTHWFFTIKFPLRDERGEISGVCGISTDITSIKQNEEQLRVQFAELQRWQDVMLNREARIIELKREVNRCAKEAGRPPVYEHT